MWANFLGSHQTHTTSQICAFPTFLMIVLPSRGHWPSGRTLMNGRFCRWVSCGQFHKHITCSFCADIFGPKKVQTFNLSTKKACAKLSYGKAARKMLVKLTPGGRVCRGRMAFVSSNPSSVFTIFLSPVFMIFKVYYGLVTYCFLCSAWHHKRVICIVNARHYCWLVHLRTACGLLALFFDLLLIFTKEYVLFKYNVCFC
jgi:hypothetical protein